MCSSLPIDSLLIYIIIVGGNLYKRTSLYYSWYDSTELFSLGKNVLCNTCIHCTHLIVGDAMSRSV